MTRKKVKLAYITNDSARKATFKKRKKGLMKKVSELSTLCGIEACAIVYSPYDSQPEAWPSPEGVDHALSRFKMLPEMEQSKKMVNQESFLRQRITKAYEQLKKQLKDNREKEMTQVMYQNLTTGGVRGLQSLNPADLNDLSWLIDHNLKNIHRRVDDELKKESQSQGVAAATTAAMVPPEMPKVQAETSAGHQTNVNVESMQRQWIMDMMINNPQDHLGMGFSGDEMNMMFPFGDNTQSHNNAFFP